MIWRRRDRRKTGSTGIVGPIVEIAADMVEIGGDVIGGAGDALEGAHGCVGCAGALLVLAIPAVFALGCAFHAVMA